MGFWSGLKNFGCQILGCIIKAVGWVTPTLNKVLDTLTAQVSIIHPTIGSAMSVDARMAGRVDGYINEQENQKFHQLLDIIKANGKVIDKVNAYKFNGRCLQQ
ncbi:MAG: hypothetical protein EZS28_035463 [Streblomastix strix]|uniref:Uncharacterized protein n=1 Tax=Streblomastix strix TaxID=222440 RepID=A0A5J4UG17_9EUKA|nr:MAG: hypothetical protein EZS28_035463 [Streblomastix strix]